MITTHFESKIKKNVIVAFFLFHCQHVGMQWTVWINPVTSYTQTLTLLTGEFHYNVNNYWYTNPNPSCWVWLGTQNEVRTNMSLCTTMPKVLTKLLQVVRTVSSQLWHKCSCLSDCRLGRQTTQGQFKLLLILNCLVLVCLGFSQQTLYCTS